MLNLCVALLLTFFIADAYGFNFSEIFQSGATGNACKLRHLSFVPTLLCIYILTKP